MRSGLAILLLLSFVPHGMYGTPQIKLPTKSLLQHTLGLQTSAQNLNKKNYCVQTEDVKAAKKEFTRVPAGSYKFISLVQARQIGSAKDEIFFPQAQITAIWSGIKRRGCFKIFQGQSKSNLIVFQVPHVLTEFCTESLVWVSERRLMVRVSGLKRVLSKAYIGLDWPVVLRCYYDLLDHCWF